MKNYPQPRKPAPVTRPLSRVPPARGRPTPAARPPGPFPRPAPRPYGGPAFKPPVPFGQKPPGELVRYVLPRVPGRLVPFLGWALLAYDLWQLWQWWHKPNSMYGDWQLICYKPHSNSWVSYLPAPLVVPYCDFATYASPMPETPPKTILRGDEIEGWIGRGRVWEQWTTYDGGFQPERMTVPVEQPVPVPVLPWPAVDPWYIPIVQPVPPPLPIPWPLLPGRSPARQPPGPVERPERGPIRELPPVEPLPPPSPEVLPVPDPGMPPVPVPTPVPTPVPSPGAVVEVEPGSPPVLQPEPPHKWRPPSGKEKERKRGLKPLDFAWFKWAASAITESSDLIKAVYDALPVKERRFYASRRGKWMDKDITPQDRLARIYANYDKLDMAKVVQNVIANQIEDYIIGRMSGKVSKKMRGRLSRPILWGPAL